MFRYALFHFCKVVIIETEVKTTEGIKEGKNEPDDIAKGQLQYLNHLM